MHLSLNSIFVFDALVPFLMHSALASDIASTSGTKSIPPSPPFSSQHGTLSRSFSSSSTSSTSSYDSFKSASRSPLSSKNSSPSRTPPPSPPRMIRTHGLDELEAYHEGAKGKIANIYHNQINLAKEARDKPWKASKNRKLIAQSNEHIKIEDGKLFRKGYEIIQKTRDPDPKKMSLKIEPIQKITYDFRDGWVGTRNNPSPRMSHAKLDELHNEATNVLLLGKPHNRQKA